MSIREVNAVAITDAVEELCIRANTQLPPDVKQPGRRWKERRAYHRRLSVR